MKLHELKILHKYLVDISIGKKTFELRKNDRDYQEGDLIRFINIKEDNDTSKKCLIEPYINEKTLYRITYVLKDVEKYGLDKDYCILAIKKLDIKEIQKMNKKTAGAGGGFTFVMLLQLAFIILKLCNVITWSWVLVLMPLIVSAVLAFVGLVCLVILIILGDTDL